MYSPFRETDPAIVPLEPLCDCALHNSTIRGRSLSRTIGKLSQDLPQEKVNTLCSLLLVMFLMSFFSNFFHFYFFAASTFYFILV